MATIKSYTDIELSKKLAEILPLKSADMYYPNSTVVKYQGALPIEFKHGNPLLSQETAAWSLAALLDYLKNKNKFPEIELSDGRFKLTTFIWSGKDCIEISIENTMVDACYRLILQLYELKIL